MRMKLWLAILAGLFMMSCHKDVVKDNPGNQPQDNETITPIGTPTGDAVRKTIGAAGGEITSADGIIKLTIPAGALAAATEIAIQPISNQLTNGIGTAYRLTPHGQTFTKPVTITFNYKVTDTTGTRQELLDIAFQNAEGGWEMLTNTTVDKTARKLVATTTHFSDWGMFKAATINPSSVTVEQGAFLELQVMTTYPWVDPDLGPPGTYTIKLLKKPRKLRDDQIKSWSLAGEGKLEPEGSWAFYTAPDHDPRMNPEVAVANVNLHRKGQFMLLSNITVIGSSSVDYLWVDEDYMKWGATADPYLYLYGNFGNDPGAGNRTVKINGVSFTPDLWTAKIIRCRIDDMIYGPIEIVSGNKVVARSVLRKFKGKFLYERFHGGLLNAGSSNALKESSEFLFVFRGFGKPCPANVNLLFPKQCALAMGTEAKYKLGGAASVSTPVVNGCVYTTSVSIPNTTGTQLLEPASLPYVPNYPEFKASVKDVEGGIEVTITDYEVPSVVSGIRVQRSSSCGPSSYDPPKPIGVGLEGFRNKVIKLEYWGTDELKLKGTSKLTSNRMSSGILIEAWDNTVSIPSHYETDGLMPATFSDIP